MLWDVKRHALSIAFIIVVSALAGCTSPMPPNVPSNHLAYEILIDGVRQGSIVYKFQDAISVRDGALRPRNTLEVEMIHEQNGESGSRFLYVDMETGRTVLFVNKCPATDLSACKNLVVVDWPEAPVDFMGAFALPTLPVTEGVLTLAPGTPWERQATVTSTPDGMRVEPEIGLNAPSPCSALTEVVTVNPETGTVLTCTFKQRGETIVFRHVSGTLPPGVGRSQGVFPRIAEAQPLEGLLPRGADFAYPPGFSLAEAFHAAMDKSAGLRPFLAKHPRAGIAEAFYDGYSSSTVLNFETYKVEKFALRFFPGGGNLSGYEVNVARKHLGAREEIPPDYEVTEGEWNVNHTIPSSADLPAAAVPLSAVDFFNNSLAGMAIRGVSVSHTNIPGIGARYQYSLSFPACEVGTCILPYAMFDALDGRLVYGILTHAQVRSLVVDAAK